MNNTLPYMSDIVGNDALKNRLCKDILSNTLSHAYILEGAQGSGKHTVSLLTAAAFSCENKHKDGFSIPCAECASCKKILSFKSPDVIFVNSGGKASLGVDVARFLKEDVYTLPNDLEHKFYIIEEADKMTHQAQNAILLTLEEPPSFVHFFLLCSNSQSLLETIRSRAPTFKTEIISTTDIDKYIQSKSDKARQMKLSSTAEYRELLKASRGSIGKALSLLEEKSWSSTFELISFVKSIVNCATRARDAKDILELFLSFSNKRDILIEQLSMICDAIRDLIMLKKSENVSLGFYCDENEAIEICDRVSLSFLFSFQEAVYTAIDELQRNSNIKLTLTKMAVCAKLI